MSKKWNPIGDYTVEVWFQIVKDKDGYPKSKSWEQLIALPVLESDEYFQIESIPFYLKNVSRGDIVKARITENKDIQEGEIFEFDSIVDRGGHNTYRLLLRAKSQNDPQFTTEELLRKGLSVEEQYGDFFAVDVPPTVDQQEIDQYLFGQCNAGRWEIQDGFLKPAFKDTQENT